MSEQLPAGTRTLPELLKEKSFHTAVMGKFFHITADARGNRRLFRLCEFFR